MLTNISRRVAQAVRGIALVIGYVVLIMVGVYVLFDLITLVQFPAPDLKPCYEGQTGGMSQRYRDCRAPVVAWICKNY
jgi:hypothetical protein